MFLRHSNGWIDQGSTMMFLGPAKARVVIESREDRGYGDRFPSSEKDLVMRPRMDDVLLCR